MPNENASVLWFLEYFMLIYIICCSNNTQIRLSQLVNFNSHLNYVLSVNINLFKSLMPSVSFQWGKSQFIVLHSNIFARIFTR